jgi:hypothetical protein
MYLEVIGGAFCVVNDSIEILGIWEKLSAATKFLTTEFFSHECMCTEVNGIRQGYRRQERKTSEECKRLGVPNVVQEVIAFAFGEVRLNRCTFRVPGFPRTE